MSKLSDLKIENLQDSWSMLYLCLAKACVNAKGIDGENILRKGIREFGYDRSRNLVKLHKSLGLKLNMKNLFSYGDLPNDPRFKRERIALNPQERISNTLVCPIADMWKRHDGRWLGRIYCEEFHHACYGSYAPHVQVNLAKTLTQVYDDHCCFAVYLRPGDQTAEERKNSFAECDPAYKEPDMTNYQPPDAKTGFQNLCVKIIFHIYRALKEAYGEEGCQIAKQGLSAYAAMETEFLNHRAESMSHPSDKAFLKENSPLGLYMEDDPLWADQNYQDDQIKDIMEASYYAPMRKIFA